MFEREVARSEKFYSLKKVFIFINAVMFLQISFISISQAEEKEKCVVMNLIDNRGDIDPKSREELNAWYMQEVKKMTRFEIISAPERDSIVAKYGLKNVNWSTGPEDAKDLFGETPIKYMIYGFIFGDPQTNKDVVEIFLNNTSPETIHLNYQIERSENDNEDLEVAIKKRLSQIDDFNTDNKTVIEDLHLTPQDYFTSGNIEYNRGDFKNSLREFNRAIAIKPDYTEAMMGRAKTKIKLGKNESALSDYDEVLKINPKETEAYLNRGILKNSMGDNKGAIEDYGKGLQIERDNYKFYMYRGLAKADMNDKKGALEDLKKAVSLSKDYMPLYELAETEYRFGDMDKAMSDYTKAINIKPDEAVLYYKRGNLKSETNDKEGACTDWKKAMQLGNKDAKGKVRKFCK